MEAVTSTNRNVSMVVIVGPTASGKSQAALDVARRFEGEIICADSRTVYKSMDIGTAKPTLVERGEIPHHLIDIIEPSESFSVAAFQHLALEACEDIRSRGRLPIVVGGSGLYIDSLLYNYQFLDNPNTEIRQELSTMSVTELQNIIAERNLDPPVNYKNHRHLSRVIETNGQKGSKSEINQDTVIVGINPGLEVIKQRIALRANEMLEQGLVKEVSSLVHKFTWESPGLQSTSYKAFRQHLERGASIEDATEQFIRNDYRLARRQLTWFRRNKSIHWTSEQSEVVDFVTTSLNKKQ